MRGLLRALVLFALLVVFCVQTLAASHHAHETVESSACAACVLHHTPLDLPEHAVAPLPREVPPLDRVRQRLALPPPPALVPLDYARLTSPPAA